MSRVIPRETLPSCHRRCSRNVLGGHRHKRFDLEDFSLSAHTTCYHTRCTATHASYQQQMPSVSILSLSCKKSANGRLLQPVRRAYDYLPGMRCGVTTRETRRLARLKNCLNNNTRISMASSDGAQHFSGHCQQGCDPSTTGVTRGLTPHRD
jgi:hypothetical protein